MKKLAVLFKKTKNHEENVFVETTVTISSGKTQKNLKYEFHNPKFDKIHFGFGCVTIEKIEKTYSYIISSNLKRIISFQSPFNMNIKNVVEHSMLKTDNVSSIPKRMFEESQELLGLQMNNRRFKKPNNTCALNIKNSRCFHIGPHRVINVKSYTQKNLQKSSFTEMTKGRRAEKFNNILEVLLESYEIPTDKVIAIIAFGLKRKWREFGSKLGFTQCFLCEIELQNEKNMTLITYDMLKHYISQFPNTTFGFIASILIEMDQKSIIHELIIQQQSEITFL